MAVESWGVSVREPSVVSELRDRLVGALRHEHVILAMLAIVVGAVTGFAIIGLREAIQHVQLLLYGTDSERFFYFVKVHTWWLVVLTPALGGLAVGLIVHRTLPEKRPQGIADVIEAYARKRGFMSIRTGLWSAVASTLSLGVGASVGREGPAVHLGASLAGWVTHILHLDRGLARTVLGCGASAAVAASFNAPIAGALFASEVIVGHYALRSFAPIVISSVVGTALARWWFGSFPAFVVSNTIFASFWEFPAFVLLGIVSAVAALVFIRGIDVASNLARMLPGPRWYRPAIAGVAVGLIALQFPQVMGVGYGTTEAALTQQFGFWLLVGIGLAKILATAICIGFGFSGGVFSPALVIGAMVGTSFGILATQVFPDLSSGPDAYALVGMGAISAAVLGAPISTTLIIFELTGDYALTLGVMIAVVVASEIVHTFYGRSFFYGQLRERGVDLKGAFEESAKRSRMVRDLMSKPVGAIYPGMALNDVRMKLLREPSGILFVSDAEGRLVGTVALANLDDKAFDHDYDDTVVASDVMRTDPPILTLADDLGTAIEVMDEREEDHIAVVERGRTMILVGCLHHRDALYAYNRALARLRHAEHDD